MLKKAFNYASLGALVGAWAGLGLFAWDGISPFFTDPALAHATSPVMTAAQDRANNVPIRREVSAYHLKDIHIAPLAPPCDTPRADKPLCDWLAFDEKRIETRNNRYGAHTRYAQAHFNHMVQYEPDAAFRAWDDERGRRAAAAIAADPFIRENYLRIVQQTGYTDIAQAREQATLKQQILQRTADIIRATYDLPPIPVALQWLPGGFGLYGSYQPVAPAITINYDVRNGVTDSFAAMISTLAHEVRHSIDADYAAMLVSGKMDRTDIRAGYAAATALNFKEYIAHTEAGLISSGHILDDAYRLQPIEKHAFTYGDKLASDIISALYCDDISRVHLCVLYTARQRILP